MCGRAVLALHFSCAHCCCAAAMQKSSQHPVLPCCAAGAMAGAIGTLVGRLRRFKVQGEERRGLYAVTCMASGFGSFLPNPMVSRVVGGQQALPGILPGVGKMCDCSLLSAESTGGLKKGSCLRLVHACLPPGQWGPSLLPPCLNPA